MSGIFGVVQRNDCVENLFYGTDYHSHLGTEYGGLAVWNRELRRKIHALRSTQFKSKFWGERDELTGSRGIGAISASQEQPILMKSRFGPFAIVMDGWIDNAEELAAELLEDGHSFSEVRRGTINHIELAAKLINRGRDLLGGIEHMFDRIEGSCTVLVLTQDGLYAARDKLGRFPLVLGVGEHGWAVTSETGALANLGYEVKKYLGPGEIVFIDQEGPHPVREAREEMKVCAFLWVYTGFPASSYEGINTEVVRERCGACLARRDAVRPDVVGGVPDSGVAHAIGYAMESGVPFRRPLVKYTPGYGRSYTPPNQAERDRVAKMKLLPIRELIEGKSVAICEDSIVRGTQLKSFTVQKLREAGAREVHVRVACPPLMYPCKYNISTRSTDELIARRAIRDLAGGEATDVARFLDPETEEYAAMVKWIERHIGVTSILYQTEDDMVAAIGLPREKLCLHCWNGR